MLKVGLLSFLGLVALPTLYLLARQLKAAWAWIQRSKPPQERVIPMVIIFAVIGFAAGSLAQNAWDSSSACRSNGKRALECMLSPA